MNFSETVKSEILGKQIKERHCRAAFVAGLIRGTGTLFFKDEQLGLDFKVGDEQTAMLVTSYIKNLFDYEIREVSVSEDRLNKKDKFVLSISGDKATSVLQALEILTEKEEELEVNLKLYGELTKNDCCLRAFIRGLFIASGGCTVPNTDDASTTGYHLELSFSHYTPALETSEKLAEYGIITKITRRRENYIVYIKSVEDIKDFIAFLPAPVSVLKLTELIISRELINDSNRRKNCDLGNVNKQVEACAKQISAIDKIEQTIGIDSLKEDLKATALARKNNPDETLNELAQRLNVSKSCLNHRLRKIVTIANEL